MSTYEILRERFAPVFARIAAGAWDRDRERVLPVEPVAWLDAERFGALRVPTERGGYGASLETVIRLLVDLSAADSNVGHLYRSHFGFAETLFWQPDDVRTRWYARLVAGETVGNASTERGGNALGELNTSLRRDADGVWRLTGEKYYCTGTIYSTYTRVSAQVTGPDGASTGERQFAVVRVDADGVRVHDDWDGFGQRLTGTGTTEFEAVAVDDADVLPRVKGTQEAVHEAAFFQLVLLAVQAGIARAARDDAAALVAGRKRTFNTGSGVPFREDPLIQAEVGRIAAQAFAAEAAVVAAARALDAAWDACAVRFSNEPGDVPAEAYAAELAVEAAHVSVPDLALGAAQALFQTVGASATSSAKGLDRHWRNAQTVATHNPIAFRARSLGDYYINGTTPEGLSAIGDAVRGGSTASPLASEELKENA
ncbi:acyl-CoA dehydrogenase family protein [Zhihengliuella sp.]|uniref:acyl-CoA dehydrogenase family protein n=1 Tax=Zhihengliuella sp. TaxID=1954483 RepID=UPI0028113D24|nr:acyl-CoA dehydrogenase family protein [Zhihengliuella sp.]